MTYSPPRNWIRAICPFQQWLLEISVKLLKWVFLTLCIRTEWLAFLHLLFLDHRLYPRVCRWKGWYNYISLYIEEHSIGQNIHGSEVLLELNIGFFSVASYCAL